MIAVCSLVLRVLWSLCVMMLLKYAGGDDFDGMKVHNLALTTPTGGCCGGWTRATGSPDRGAAITTSTT